MAKDGNVILEGGMEISDDKSYFLNRNRLIQQALNLVDKALTNQETMKTYSDALDGARDRIEEIISGVVVDDEIVKSTVEGIALSGQMSCNIEPTYKQPIQVRAKGCGKRLKGGKENALKKAKTSKGRKCNGCGLYRQNHDKRNWPNLIKNGSSQATITETSSEDERYSVEDLNL